MKACLAFLLALTVFAQSLLPRTATDLLHSPDVWNHFEEHKTETSAPLSFWQFLWMHYSADSEHTKQTKHHLPSFDFNSIAYFFVLPSALVSLDIKRVVTFLASANFHWLNSYAFLSFKALICPPRA